MEKNLEFELMTIFGSNTMLINQAKRIISILTDEHFGKRIKNYTDKELTELVMCFEPKNDASYYMALYNFKNDAETNFYEVVADLVLKHV